MHSTAPSSIGAGVEHAHIGNAAALRARGIALHPEHDADRRWLQDLYASTRSDELARVPWSQTAKRAFLDQQFELQRAHYRQHFADAEFLIVRAGDTRIGRLYLQRSPTAHLLVDISLLPQWRGRGIGSALICVAQASAQQAGCRLSLHVLHANPAAQRLYVRHGFVAGLSSETHLQMHWHPHNHTPGAGEMP